MADHQTQFAEHPLTAKRLNLLAKRLGSITNKIEKERDRHAARTAQLEQELDAVYGELGGEEWPA